MLFRKKTCYNFINEHAINKNLRTHIFTINEENEKYYYQGTIKKVTNDATSKHLEVWDGYGKLWSNTFTYNGFFKNGLPHGKGIYKYVGNIDEFSKEFVKVYEGQFKEGMKHGEGKEIYLNNESYIGKFERSLRHGKGTYYATNGSKKIEGYWDMGYAKGTNSIIDYWENGNIKYKGGFDGNKWHGKGVFCYPNGNICYDGIFTDGVPINGIIKNNDGIKLFEGSLTNNETCTLYYDNGNRFIEYLNYDENTSSYEIKEYFSNGLLSFNGYIYNSLHKNLKNVLLVELVEHINNLKEQIKYKKGNFYYVNSNINTPKIKCTCEYNKNNELIGDYKEFYKNGILSMHTIYNNNKINGFYKTFHKNGKPNIEANYENYVLVGEYKEFSNENDFILKQGTYVNGILKSAIILNNNQQIVYEGDIDIENKYINNGKLYYDNNSNSIKYEGVFENNKYNGNGSLYFPNGNFAYQGDWVNGVKHGQGSSYYESTGTMEYIGDWVNDEKHGSGSLFNEYGEQVWSGNFHYNEIQMPVQNNEEMSDD